MENWEAIEMFRKGTINDCKKVYDMICELENKQLSYSGFSKIYQKQINDKRYYCLVCEKMGQCGPEIVAVLNLRFEEQLHHTERIAEILEFIVSSSCRNQGIGQAMLAYACRLARDMGCSQIEVSSNRKREDAHRFYEKEGMDKSHFTFTKILDAIT